MKYEHEIYFFGIENPIYILNEENNLNELNEMIKEFGYNPTNVTTINTNRI